MPTLKYSIDAELLNAGLENKSFINIDILEKKWYDDLKFLSLYDRDTLAAIDGQIGLGDLDGSEIKFLLKQVFAEANLTDAECRRILSEVLQDRKSAKDIDGSLRLPDTAPELYENRIRPESPIAFYARVWRKYEEAGLLFQDNLRHLDGKLIPAIHTYCSRERIEAREHLPPSRNERTKRLAKAGDRYARKLLDNAERRSRRGIADPVIAFSAPKA